MDAWIIDRIRKEREQRERQERPALRLPVPPPPAIRPEGSKQDEQERGVTTIDYTV